MCNFVTKLFEKLLNIEFYTGAWILLFHLVHNYIKKNVE